MEPSENVKFIVRVALTRYLLSTYVDCKNAWKKMFKLRKKWQKKSEDYIHTIYVCLQTITKTPVKFQKTHYSLW